MANDFNSEQVDISNGTASAYDSSMGESEQEIGDRISNFFKNLFDDEDEASSHISAARKGSIFTVHASSEETTLCIVMTLLNN